MYSLRLHTCQLGSGNITCTITKYVNIKMWAPSLYSWIQMYNISFNASVQYDSFPSGLQATVQTRPWSLETGLDFALRWVSVTPLQTWSVQCNFSHLTEDDREIYMDTGVVKLHNALKKETEQTIFKSRDSSKHLSIRSQLLTWPFFTCGIRFFWILFNLDFFLPFFVTTVSS